MFSSPFLFRELIMSALLQYGANKSLVMTKTSTLGLWVPVHDEEWDGNVPRPSMDRDDGEETECGEIAFKNSTLPWQTGDYEVRLCLTISLGLVLIGSLVEIPSRWKVQRCGPGRSNSDLS